MRENKPGAALSKSLLLLSPAPRRGVLPTFPSNWWGELVFSHSLLARVPGKVCPAPLTCDYFRQGFRLHSSLLYLIHLRGKKENLKTGSNTGTLWRECLYQALVFLSSWNSYYMSNKSNPGFLSQLLAPGQIPNLGLDNKSTAEVISALSKGCLLFDALRMRRIIHWSSKGCS